VETVVVIGLGEVGKPLYGLFRASDMFSVYGYDVRGKVSPYRFEELPRGPDYLHIAYPYSEHFIESTLRYVEVLRPGGW